ncbi:MAG: hypothetical protein WC565_10355 [Parcubacteria group bacterium]
MKYGARRPVVLQVREPSMGMIQLGKITMTHTKTGWAAGWAYCNNISAQMLKTAEYAIAPCVVELMTEWRVYEVVYYDAHTVRSFRTSLAALTDLGHIKRYGNRPAYWHLPISEWEMQPGQVFSDYCTEMLMLEWGPEVAAQPAQLAFSL